jgi:hypothetical protein
MSVRRPPPREALLAVLLLALTAAARLAAAWLLRHEATHDFTVVQLMVRHVLAGERWPVFFFGQAYMGSLEPLTSALLAALCGYSTFVVNCGTALYGWAAMVLVVIWARHLGGWRAAWTAAFAGLVGPGAHLHYMATPRGGYGTLIFFTVALLAWGGWLLERECAGRPAGFAPYLLLGALAGACFWCNMLIGPAIAALAAVFLCWRRARVFRGPILAGTLLGFGVASAPLWLWNMSHDWATFGMSRSLVFDVSTVRRNLGLLVGERFAQLLGVAEASPAWRWTIVLAALALAAPAWSLLRRPRRGQPPAAATLHLSLVAAWLAVFTVGFALSTFAGFNTPRYLIPLVPLMALLAGLGCAMSSRRMLRGVAFAALLLLGGWQLLESFRLVSARGARDARHTSRNRAVAAFLQARGVTAAYNSYVRYALNLAADERICFSDPKMERIPDYVRRLEADPAPAAIEDYGGARGWAAASGGACSHTNISGLRVAWAFQPPRESVRELPPAQWLTAVDADGHDWRTALTDRRATTAARPGAALRDGVWSLTIALRAPATLSGLRLWGAEERPFASWRLEGRSAAGLPFVTLVEETAFSSFFWSGPRFFWHTPHLRQELRFAPARLTELRLHIKPYDRRGAFALPELQVLTPAAEPDAPAGADGDLAPLLAALRARGVERLYADRWIANAVHLATTGTLWTSQVRLRAPAEAGASAQEVQRVRLDARTALLVPPAGAPALRAVLAARRLDLRESDLGEWGILFDAAASGQSLERVTGLLFLGAYACLENDTAWFLGRLSDPDGAPSLQELDDFLAFEPNCVPALRLRLAHARKEDEKELQARLAARLESLTRPTLGASATFAARYTWLGCRLLEGAERPRPGATFTMRHYWLADKPPAAGHYALFVHFVGPGGYRFQDDHGLIERPGAWPSSAQAPWTEDRTIAIPADAPPGAYELRIGVCDASFPSARLPVRSRLPRRRRAVLLPGMLTVAAPTPNTRSLP